MFIYFPFRLHLTNFILFLYHFYYYQLSILMTQSVY